MAFFTRPRLDDLQFRQLTDDVLTLSGTTIFEKNNGGLTLSDQSGNTIPVLVETEGGGLDNGKALVYSGGTIILGQGGGGGAAFLSNLSGGTGLIFKDTTGGFSNLRSLSGGTGVDIVTSGNVITITSNGGTLGVPPDGTYSDGLFPFTASTGVGKAVDDINEFLGLLAPAQPPILDDVSTFGTFVDGKLSFGVNNDIITYTNVEAGFGGSALDVNDNFPTGIDRKGLTQNSLNASISGILNDDVSDGDPSGVPYRNDSFRDGSQGVLSLELNGVVVDTIDLEATPNTDLGGNGFLSVSQVFPVKFDNGNDFGSLVYRQGVYQIPTTEFRNGYNYLQVIHSSSTFNRTTNFTNWVYDSNAQGITFVPVSGGTDFQSVNFGAGRNFVSGVEYYRTGNVVYQGTASNVYRNVYSNSNTAITFPDRVYLSNVPSAISVVGTGILNGSSRALPNLNTAVSNPETTDITITATLDIDSTKVLGNKLFDDAPLGLPGGELKSNIDIKHPFPVKKYLGSSVNERGFLLYDVDQSINFSSENFNGEADRIRKRDYEFTSYSLINSSNYNWISSQSLTGTNTQHNTGLLVFNGGLYYPNANLLNTEYSIVNGNFNAMKYRPAVNPSIGNANYGGVTGVRDYYRRFKSGNGADLARLVFKIIHTGSGSDFLTNAGDGGTPTGDQVKFEFIIKRQNNQVLPYANPFSTDGGAQGGIQNQGGFIDTTRNAVGLLETTVEANLTTNRVGFQDIIIVRVKANSGYNNKITNIEIDNIV